MRIGVDTGGTFTDVVLYDPSSSLFLTHKLPSTPDNPALAVLRGIEAIITQASTSSGELEVVHGSTVATNAVLEGKGGHVAFVNTAGFEDLLWLGRQQRSSLYALYPKERELPLAREASLGCQERMSYKGSPLVPLQDEEVNRLVEALSGLEVESVAVSLLHSYANPAHEQALAAAIREHLPHVHLTLSSELLPEFREVERASTCLVNALVAPKMGRYLRVLREELGEEHLKILSSAGGGLPAKQMEAFPVHTILSGPAGGVVGAFEMGQHASSEQLITLDMGGTSTDVSLCMGDIQRTQESEVAGLPLRLPLIDIETVGAGGGSVAWIDPGGVLQVGPASMGATPGPACYGQQSEPYQATVTDAHLVLGHLSPSQTLAGSLTLQPAPAFEAIDALADQAGLSREEMAQGILRVAEAHMARAVQRISMQRGFDPRTCALLPFGGAGGLHACELASQLGMKKVLLPRYPGLLSAFGMLCAPLAYDLSSSLMLTVPALPSGDYPDLRALPEVEAACSSLQERARQLLTQNGHKLEQMTLSVAADIRYVGQSYELTLPLDRPCVASAFLEEHQRLYGYVAQGRALEMVALRLSAKKPSLPLVLPPVPQRAPGDTAPALETREVYHKGSLVSFGCYARESLAVGDTLSGPLILSEYSGTTVVPPGWHVEVVSSGLVWLKEEDK